MKDISKEKLYGIVGTLLFHLAVLVLLYFIVMEQIPLQPEKSNIEMQSAIEDLAGEEFFEAKMMTDVQPQVSKSDPAPEAPAKDPLIAQNYEESMPVDTLDSKKQEKQKPVVSEEEKRRKEEAERLAAEEAARRAAEEAERKAKEKIANSVAGTFGKSSSLSSKSGESEGEGVGSTGSTAGGTDKGVVKGSGNGLGIEYKVGNHRVVGELDRNIPVQEEGELDRNIPVQEEGVVIVNVTVNPQGKVVSANAKTASIALKQAAEKAAYEIRFNNVSDLTENESGTITFRFNMKY